MQCRRRSRGCTLNEEMVPAGNSITVDWRTTQYGLSVILYVSALNFAGTRRDNLTQGKEGLEAWAGGALPIYLPALRQL
jgi:hypothetical protein